jgi:hypothetical protein
MALANCRRLLVRGRLDARKSFPRLVESFASIRQLVKANTAWEPPCGDYPIVDKVHSGKALNPSYYPPILKDEESIPRPRFGEVREGRPDGVSKFPHRFFQLRRDFASSSLTIHPPWLSLRRQRQGSQFKSAWSYDSDGDTNRESGDFSDYVTHLLPPSGENPDLLLLFYHIFIALSILYLAFPTNRVEPQKICNCHCRTLLLTKSF